MPPEKPRDRRPIIIVRKKKVGGGGHHGGSWKVAYADFVTAMMAFFLVMWIVGMDQPTKEAIEGYFSNPVGVKKGYAGGTNPLSMGQSPVAVRSQVVQLVVRAGERERLEAIARDLRRQIEQSPRLQGLGRSIEVVVTEQGLRIELIEAGKGEIFFGLGSAAPTAIAATALDVIAEALVPLENPLVIEGHTDAVPYPVGSARSNWELSSERANAARRLLEIGGIQLARIEAVRGLADRQLRNREDPLDAANRRISILLPFLGEGEPGSTVTATGDSIALPAGAEAAPLSPPVAPPGSGRSPLEDELPDGARIISGGR